MTKRHSSEANGASELRKRAEEELAKASRSEEADRGKADDIEHELRLHQVELEIQNEELRSAQVELTQVHDRLKNLYDYAPVGYATLTAKGLIHESNHKLADMLNTPRHDLDMSRFSSLILPEDQDIYYHCRRNFLAGRGGSSCELRMLRKGRDPFWANLELALDEQGAKGDPCLRVVISDIDSRKRAEERESVMRKKLEEAERLAAVGVLAAGVAHDLNNLLGPILTLPDFIEEELTDIASGSSAAKESTIESLQAIRSAARLSSAVVRDLGQLSTEGHYSLSPLDLHSLECFSKTSPLQVAQRNRPELQVSIEMSPEELTIMGERGHLNRAIMNLMKNALESISGAGEVRVSTRKVLLEGSLQDSLGALRGSYALVTVEDSGCGMNQTDVAHIFEPYYTTKEFSSEVGSGLGLSVVHATVKAHNGYMAVESKLGKGSIFRIYLPLTEGITMEPGDTASSSQRGSERVLVADDAPGQRLLVCRALKRLGYAAQAVNSGRDAVALFREAKNSESRSPFDLVLLDIIMENDFDGIETCDAIRGLYPHQRILMISGTAQRHWADEADSRGLGLLSKPFMISDLAAAVRRTLDASE